MSGCAVGIQRLDQTCAGCSTGLQAGQGAGSAHPAPGPHRILGWDLLAASLHPWCWFCPPPCFVPPGLGLWLCCSVGTHPLSWIRACLRGALPPWAAPASRAHLPLQHCPCPELCYSLPEHILLPPESLPVLPLERPFPSRRQAPAAVHGSKWRH